MAIRIADVLPIPVEIDTGYGSFPVHGLGLEKIAQLFHIHGEVLGLFIGAAAPSFEDLVGKFPTFAYDVIACAADAEDQIEDIARLPVPVLLDALLAIWKLSVPDPKKFIELLAGLGLKPQLVNRTPEAPVESNQA